MQANTKKNSLKLNLSQTTDTYQFGLVQYRKLYLSLWAN